MSTQKATKKNQHPSLSIPHPPPQILLVAHPKIGCALKETVEMIMGFIPLKLHVIEISYNCEPIQEIKRITKEVIRKAKHTHFM